MISRFLYIFQDGVRFVRQHLSLLVTLLMVVIIPVAFVLSANQFLSVSKMNQERLEKDRVGLLHDTFLSLVQIADGDTTVLQSEIEKIAHLNPDVVAFRVSLKSEDGYIPVAALNNDIVGSIEPDSQIYDFAFANPNESILQFVEIGGNRYIRGTRLVEFDGQHLVILTVTSRSAIDTLFAQRERRAWVWMAVILAVVMLLVFRHVRLIDYSYLYRETKKVNESKDLFTNMIAHELRAPLTAMRGYASMIDESESATDDIRKYAVRISDSSERLLAIVNDLLDVARIQSGKLRVEKELSNLSEIIVAVTEELGATAAEKHIGLTTTGTDIELRAEIDRKRMHQALTNLVSNALKYTKHGSIEVSIEKKTKQLEVRVKDTGMGISADDQKKLFAPFFRVENQDVNAITGTGLGMWITRQLVELMGATISVESIKGVGTHIVLTIPLSH